MDANDFLFWRQWYQVTPRGDELHRWLHARSSQVQFACHGVSSELSDCYIEFGESSDAEQLDITFDDVLEEARIREEAREKRLAEKAAANGR